MVILGTVCKQFHCGLYFAKRKYKFTEECIYSSLSRVKVIQNSCSKLEVWNKSIIYGNLDILLTIEGRPFSSSDVYIALLYGHVHIAEYLSKIGIIHDCPQGIDCSHIREDLRLDLEEQINILCTENHKSITWLRKHDFIDQNQLQHSIKHMIRKKNVKAVRYLTANFDYGSRYFPDEFTYLAINTNNIEIYSCLDSFVPYQAQISYAILHFKHNIIRYILQHLDLNFLRSTMRCYVFLHRETSLEFSIMNVFAAYDDLEGIKKALSLGFSIDLRHILTVCGRRNNIKVFEYVLSLCPYDMENLHEIVNDILRYSLKEPRYKCLNLFYKKDWKYKIDKSKLKETIRSLRDQDTNDSSNILELINSQ